MVTASAIAITLGSCRCGLAKRVVSGATASQPTNDSIRVVAARPTGGQPSGASSASQATIEAGPASAAARPGSSSRPGPSRAPMYSAAHREVVRLGESAWFA